MAEAKQSTKTVVESVITLTLTKEEAEMLIVLASYLGGPIKTSPRKVYVGIADALIAAGVTTSFNSRSSVTRYIDRRASGIYFTEKPYRSDVTPLDF